MLQQTSKESRLGSLHGCTSCGYKWRYCPVCGAALNPPPLVAGAASPPSKQDRVAKTPHMGDTAQDVLPWMKERLPQRPVPTFELFCLHRLQLESTTSLPPEVGLNSLSSQQKRVMAQQWLLADKDQKRWYEIQSAAWGQEMKLQAAKKQRLSLSTRKNPMAPSLVSTDIAAAAAGPSPPLDSTSKAVIATSNRLLREVRGAVTSYGLYYAEKRREGVGMKRIRDLWCSLRDEEKRQYDEAAAIRRCEVEATKLLDQQLERDSETVAQRCAAEKDTDEAPSSAVDIESSIDAGAAYDR